MLRQRGLLTWIYTCSRDDAEQVAVELASGRTDVNAQDWIGIR